MAVEENIVRTVVAQLGKERPAFYRSDVISGFETSAGRARAMMHKFAVAPARLIDNGGRSAIGIALRPQHIIGDVLGLRLSSSSWSARRQIEFLVELKTSHT